MSTTRGTWPREELDLSEAAFHAYVDKQARWTAFDCWLEAARRSAVIVAEKDYEIARLRAEIDRLIEEHREHL